MDYDRAAREVIAGPEDAGRRLDKVMRTYLDGASLSEIYAALRKGRIRVNGAKSSPDRRVEAGDRISLDVPRWPEPSLPSIPASPAPVADDLASIADILILATEDLLFINKPRGAISQGDARLDGRIRLALAARSAGSLSFAPGPLHRLDRNTTGVIAFSRSAAGARAFASLMRQRKLAKRYLALVDGIADSPAEWQDRMARDPGYRKSAVADAGAEAYASMTPLATGGGRSLLLVQLRSGLTHQIRVQASSRGLPLSGDRKYGGAPFRGGYILHALALGFPEPPFADTPRAVFAPLPTEAFERLAELFGEQLLRSALDFASANMG